MSGEFTVFFAMALDMWPIPEAAILVSESVNGMQVHFIGLPDGSCGVRVVRGEVFEDYETDIILPESGFKIVVAIQYVSGSLCVRVNGAELACAPLGVREKGIFTLNAQLVGAFSNQDAFSTDIPPYASDAEALFIRTIGDLAQASVSNDWHVLLKSSAALRLLLLDGLLDKVNKGYGLNFGFEIACDNGGFPVEFDKRWYSVAPHDSPEDFRAVVNRDRLLEAKVYESKGGA